MKDLKARRGAFYLKRAVAEGEHEHQDFKYQISDAAKIARSISAFANHGGGCLLIGVKDNGVIAGVRNEEDIYVVEQAAGLYCRPEQKVEFSAFTAEDGAVVIRARVEASDVRPVMARHPDGSWHAYYRVADENILAPKLMVEAWRGRHGGRSPLLALTDRHRGLLSELESAGADGVTIDELMRRARMSESTFSMTVSDLYTMDVVDFHFGVGRMFRLILSVYGNREIKE